MRIVILAKHYHYNTLFQTKKKYNPKIKDDYSKYF
jgi:hypothetical protein